MQQFHLTMMCSTCKIKITRALNDNGYHDFSIDMASSILTFENDVDSKNVLKVISGIGYRIIPIEEVKYDDIFLTDDDIYNGLINNKK